MAQKDVEAEMAKQFVVHWQRRKAFLYKRSVRGESAGGRPIFEDKLVGPVDAEVAQKWQARGDWSAPPPLHVEEEPQVEPLPPLPPPGQPFDEALREAAGRWMAAKAHALEAEKYKPVDEEAAWKAFMAQWPPPIVPSRLRDLTCPDRMRHGPQRLVAKPIEATIPIQRRRRMVG